jgi:hypothetical protein
MLGMAFFKSLVKHHGREFFEPIGKALQAAGIKKPNPLNPAHAWALKGPLFNYGRWFLGQKLRPTARVDFPGMPDQLQQHAQFAASRLQKMALEISNTMSKHQLALADRQCRMAALSAKIQHLLTMLCTTLYAARHDDEVIHAAANVLCLDLTRQITGGQPSDRYFRAVNQLGSTVLDGGFQSVAGVDTGEILMSYQNQ